MTDWVHIEKWEGTHVRLAPDCTPNGLTGVIERRFDNGYVNVEWSDSSNSTEHYKTLEKVASPYGFDA